MSRIALVTGGAGFIGSHLTAHLCNQGWQVIVLDNLTEGCTANLRFLGVEAELTVQDVAEPQVFDALAGRSIDVIFHLAAQTSVAKSSQDPLSDFRTNVLGTLHTLEFARREKVSKVVFPSTVSVYTADASMPIGENAPTRASSPYGAAKAAAENYCFAYAASYHLDVTVLRLFNVFGPLMTKYVIHDLVRKLQRDPHHLVILGDGHQIRDYLYVEDAVRAFTLAAECGKSGQVYNVGSGAPICIRDLAHEIVAVMGLEAVEIEYTMETWPGDINAWSANISKIGELGFCPQVSREDGLKRTVKFLTDYPAGVSQSVDDAHADSPPGGLRGRHKLAEDADRLV